MDPAAISAGNDALCPQDDTESAAVQGQQGCLDLSLGEFLCGLNTPGGKYLICVMMVMFVVVTAAVVIVIVVMVVVLLVVVTAAAMVIVIVVMVMVLLVVVTATAMILVIVMMVVLLVVVSAAAMIIVIVVMMMVLLVVVTAAAVVIVIVVMVMVLLVVVIAAAMFIVIVVMVMVVMFLLQFLQLRGQGCLAFHRFQQLGTGQLTPRGRDDGGALIMLTQKRNGIVQFLLRNGVGTGENDGGGGLYLVIIELAEVLHIDLHLAGIHNRNGKAQGHFVIGDLLNGCDHIRQLAHT